MPFVAGIGMPDHVKGPAFQRFRHRFVARYGKHRIGSAAIRRAIKARERPLAGESGLEPGIRLDHHPTSHRKLARLNRPDRSSVLRQHVAISEPCNAEPCFHDSSSPVKLVPVEQGSLVAPDALVTSEFN
jgi:hypothetical protein